MKRLTYPLDTIRAQLYSGDLPSSWVVHELCDHIQALKEEIAEQKTNLFKLECEKNKYLEQRNLLFNDYTDVHEHLDKLKEIWQTLCRENDARTDQEIVKILKNLHIYFDKEDSG